MTSLMWWRSRLGLFLRQLAHRQYDAGRLDVAMRLLLMARRVSGQDSWLLDFQGLISWRLSRPEDAIKYYQAALTCDPRNDRARGRLAYVYATLGRKQEALYEANQLRLSGGATGAFSYRLGQVLAEEQGDHASALPWFELAEAEGDQTAALGRAHCLLNLNRPEEALAAYREIETRGAHSSIELRSKLGIAKALFDLGDPEAALRTAREAANERSSDLTETDIQHAADVVSWLEEETGAS